MNRTATREAPARNVRADAFVAQMERTQRAAVIDAIERQDMAELEREQIACRIKQARKEAGLTQPEMAEALGVIQRTYQNYESTKEPRTPWGLMNDIAKVTGKTTEWLIHGDKATPDLAAALNGDRSADLAELHRKVDRILKALGIADEKVDPSTAFARAFQAAAQTGGSQTKPDEGQSATGS